jgi:hypothetical protein
MTRGFIAAILIGASLSVPSQTKPKTFKLHIIKIQHVKEGCNVDAESTSVRFRLTSDAASACGMLRAGESYKAVRGTLKNDPQNETKDTANLVIYNNEKNMRRDNAVFDVDLEEEIMPK